MLAEIPEVGLDQARRHHRQKNLAALRRGANARATMHVDTHVTLIGPAWFSRMQTHTNPYGGRGQQGLSRLRRRDGIAGLGEGVEQRVPLRIHLDAAMAREGLTKQRPVLVKSLAVPIPE